MVPEGTTARDIFSGLGILVYAINSSSNYFICLYLDATVRKTQAKVQEIKREQFKTKQPSFQTGMTNLESQEPVEVSPSALE